MKKISILLLPVICASLSALADTPLTIGTIPPGPGGACYDDTVLVQNPPSATGNFTLPGLSGTGVVSSSVSYVVSNPTHQSWYRYNYSIDMTNLPASANHCVRMLVHFGTPHTCTYDVLVFSGSGGAGAVSPSTASRTPLGDVTFSFGSGCLYPNQKSASFAMLTDQTISPKTNVVTIIDDYIDPNSNISNEFRINVTAVVPDVPPVWVITPQRIPTGSFQGFINQLYPTNPAPSGPWDLTLRLYDAPSNGLPVGQVITQTVLLSNGVFTAPLPVDPGSLASADRWLDVAVRPSSPNPVAFTSVGRLPLTPTPQALYAYSAGVVADILPNQAVTSLNGITGNAQLIGGQGIQLTINGDGRSILISLAGQSDRNLKTDFAGIRPDEILDKVMRLPITTWRFTNELDTIRHLGPMAQDFKKAFGLGSGDTTIGMLDEGGVALSAIQSLGSKVDQQSAELKQKNARIEELEFRLNRLEELLARPEQVK